MFLNDKIKEIKKDQVKKSCATKRKRQMGGEKVEKKGGNLWHEAKKHGEDSRTFGWVLLIDHKVKGRKFGGDHNPWYYCGIGNNLGFVTNESSGKKQQQKKKKKKKSPFGELIWNVRECSGRFEKINK